MMISLMVSWLFGDSDLQTKYMEIMFSLLCIRCGQIHLKGGRVKNCSAEAKVRLRKAECTKRSESAYRVWIPTPPSLLPFILFHDDSQLLTFLPRRNHHL
ncbi:hypothetical protein RIF29_36674 [Crotalaria pallida]|uniref:Uncharacterized protein n=1 Tax=Crotalaria pallida TaxID=3830 RepID=A0AAN9EBC7_CROPI